MKDIPNEQIRRRLAAENPWWGENAAIPKLFREWRPRPYLDLFLPHVEDRGVRRAAVLMGPRRVGKTVLLHHAIAALLKQGVAPRQICYLSVDHPLYTGLDPDQLLELYGEASGIDYRTEPCFVFFDEIQYLKSWERYLKTIVDRLPTVKCIASGSAAAALRLKSMESGAGRFTDFLLPPLTFYEYLHLLELDDQVTVADQVLAAANVDKLNASFLEYLNHGGYPEALFSPAIRRDPDRYIKSDIIDKVLLRDLPGLYGIQDIQELNHLFTTLAFNTAGEVSLEGLTKGSGVAKNTIKRYITYLEAAFLIRTVHRVDRSARRFQRANFFKVYLTNPSLHTALFAPIEADEPSAGALVETAIFAQWFHRPEPIHYARWQDGEVDLVRRAPRQGVRWALEVKWSDRFATRPRELAALLTFCRTNRLSKAWVTTRTVRDVERVDDIELEFVPASLYAYAVGYNGIVRRGQGPLLSGIS